jgi:hypothetical protein
MKPIRRADGRWQVYIPRKLSQSGRREARYFASECKAEKFAAEYQADHREHGRQAVTADERHWINVARKELGSLDRLRDVLDHWHRTGAGVTSTAARDAAQAYLEWRKADRLNPATRQDIRWRLNAFAAHFGERPLHQLTAGDVERWLRPYTEGWARRSMYKAIRPMFAHAKCHRWLQYNPIDDLLPPTLPAPKREVYSPEQYQRLLKAAFAAEGGELWLYLILSGNGFFRSQELVRKFGGEPVLEWSDFLWDRQLIHVREEVAKSTRRKSGNERFVPIHQNIYDWMHEFRNSPVPTEGRVIAWSVKHFQKQLKQLHQTADVPFIDNGMRKSAISHYLAAHPDVGVVELSRCAGNSEASCRQYYLKILTEDEGKAWFDAPMEAFREWSRENEDPEFLKRVAEWEAGQLQDEPSVREEEQRKSD